jgi:acetyl esterase/lipase
LVFAQAWQKTTTVEETLVYSRSSRSRRHRVLEGLPRRIVVKAVGGALALAVLLPTPALSLPIATDVVYKVTSTGVQIGLDVYLPPGPGPFPGLVIVHGGGFKNGGKGPCSVNCWSSEGERAASAGFAAFVIDYRLTCNPNNVPAGVTSPDLCGPYRWERPEPHAAVKDVHDAIAWVRANAGTYNVNPDAVGVLGGSAGGNLAAMAGVTDDPTLYGADKADAVAVWSPALLTEDPPSAGDIRYIGCNRDTCPDEWSEAAPMVHVTSDDAPTYIANSANEIMPLAGARDFAATLTAAGVPNMLTVVPGRKHERKYEDKVWDETVAWLHQYLD